MEIETQEQPAPRLISLDSLKENSKKLRIFGRDTDIIASDPIWQKIRMEMEGILRMQRLMNLLIDGETGVGKELVARTLHASHSKNSKGPFVPINCGAMPEEIFESELFGHKRGAFTGAVEDKKGLFEVAKGGVIFLDEVGDLPLTLQTKLLRVLQERKIRAVGRIGEIDVSDVFVICATNRDLKDLIVQGKFRQDLFYRIDMAAIEVPPLRERREDIPGLIGFFMERYCESGKPQYILPAAMEKLMAYAWPGNVRELENVIAKAVIRRNGRDDMINTVDIGNLYSANFNPEEPRGAQGPMSSLYQNVHQVEKDHIMAILEKTRGNIMQAAEIAGMDRSNFKRICRRLGIKIEHVRKVSVK